jgi:hypothetical protein
MFIKFANGCQLSLVILNMKIIQKGWQPSIRNWGMCKIQKNKLHLLSTAYLIFLNKN